MKKIRLAIFFNNLRGLKTLYFLKKKKKIEVIKVYLAKKNLNKNIEKLLKKKSIKFEIIKNVNDIKIYNFIKKKNIDFNVLAGFPYILKKKIIYSAKVATINLHGGRLPEYRGGSPLNWQIINGEKYIGISILKTEEKIDSGEIIIEKKFLLKENYNIKKVHEIANKYFQKITYQAIEKLLKKKHKFKKIVLKKSNYYPQRSQSDGKINWKKMNSRKINNLIRACSHPYPGAFTFNSQKKKVTIFDAKLTNIQNKKLQLGEVIKCKNFYFVKSKPKILKIVNFEGRISKGEILN
tara:strand:- start:2624 stop:3505 length:882 start_codon:yes stop_codon:yes gene_type:complete